MVQPFIGEVRLVGFNWAPRSWAKCDGQLLAISQFDALFSLIGTTYGGDGRTTFALPELRGRIPIHWGSGPGLTPRTIGSKGGSDTVTLTAQQTAAHSHTWQATTDGGQNRTPLNNAMPQSSADIYSANDPPSNPVTMAASMLQPSAGSSQAHDNDQPVQAINYVMALYGIYPTRH